MTSRAKDVVSPAQSRNVDRKPWTVMSTRPIRRRSIAIDMLDRCLPVPPRNTSWSGEAFLGRSEFRMAIARALNGTWCSAPAFILAAGTVQSAWLRSTSPHVIPSVSPDRAAVTPASCPVIKMVIKTFAVWRGREGTKVNGESAGKPQISAENGVSGWSWRFAEYRDLGGDVRRR